MEEIIVIALFKEKPVIGKGEPILTCVPLDKDFPNPFQDLIGFPY